MRKSEHECAWLSFVGYDGTHRHCANPAELEECLRELPSVEDRRSRLFSYTRHITTSLLQALYRFPEFERFRSYPPGLDRNPDGTSFEEFDCECSECLRGYSCGGSILECNFEYYQLSEDSTRDQETPLKEKSRFLFGKDRLKKTEKFTSKGIKRIAIFKRRDEIAFEGGGLHSTVFKQSQVQLRILRFIDSNGIPRLEAFHLGPNTLESVHPTALSYVLEQVEHICGAWDILLGRCKKTLLALNREVLGESENLQKDRIITQNLIQYAQMWEEFRSVQAQQFDAVQGLKSYSELNKNWYDILRHLPDSKLHGTEEENRRKLSSQMESILERLQDIERKIEIELVTETRHLISRTESIISIDEAYNSRDRNGSMRRLSWITFIFLPLAFVASLFGMNVNLLENNPSWTYYIYFSIPLFLVLILAVVLIKHFNQSIAPLLKHIASGPSRNQRQLDLEEEERCSKSCGPKIRLPWAARNGLEAVVHQLLENGSDVDEKSNSGTTALQEAAIGGHWGIVKHLLLNNAEVNAPAHHGSGPTVLQAAAGGGHTKIVEQLIRAGADVNAAADENSGRTALQAAAEGGHIEVVEVLLRERAKVNGPATKYFGRTALQAAAGGGHVQVVELLLQKGAEVNAPGSMYSGRTALQAAAEGGHTSLVERLRQMGAH